eukprot:COSAG01_NODE_3470_length_6049_cov_689.357815_5_plen_132_part_00
MTAWPGTITAAALWPVAASYICRGSWPWPTGSAAAAGAGGTGWPLCIHLMAISQRQGWRRLWRGIHLLIATIASLAAFRRMAAAAAAAAPRRAAPRAARAAAAARRAAARRRRARALCYYYKAKVPGSHGR